MGRLFNILLICSGGVFSIVLIFILLFYLPFISDELQLKESYDGSKTTITAQAYDVSFDINDDCYIDSEVANYMITKKWSGWLFCENNHVALKLYSANKAQLLEQFADEAFLDPVEGKKRIFKHLDQKNNTMSVYIFNKVEDRVLIISTGKDAISFLSDLVISVEEY